MDILHDPNLEPEYKILILMYILLVVLPEILDEMPEIYQDNPRLQASWLLKQLNTKK